MYLSELLFEPGEQKISLRGAESYKTGSNGDPWSLVFGQTLLGVSVTVRVRVKER